MQPLAQEESGIQATEKNIGKTYWKFPENFWMPENKFMEVWKSGEKIIKEGNVRKKSQKVKEFQKTPEKNLN